MASWWLRCGNCELTFAESVIDNTIWSFLLPAKPTLPVGGSDFECPHCGRKAIDESRDYIYHA